MIGKQFGQYEILEQIGAGGMGEVYRARDRELGRDVAIKVLPPSVARDRERLTSFRQEARTLAGIQHPNIASVYGFDSEEGVEYFVQELVEGESLADKLRREATSIDEVLSIGRQIADALEGAHAAGVVHRDLKPDNVMVSSEGTVKVLDFGLATPAIDVEGETPPVPLDEDATPTMSDVTPEHIIMGTPSYMSPDQARGRQVDHRGDIWSFGCVLYEMLTGRRAFDGDTLLDTLSAVVRMEPDWDAVPDDAPPRLVRLIRRCLRKRLKDRLQHVGDARIELEEMLADPDARRMPGAEAAAPETRSRPFAALLVTALLAAALGWVGARWLGDSTPTSPPLHAALTVPDDARLVVDTAVGVAISPDGSRVAYTATVDGVQRLHLQSLAGYELQVVPGEEDVNNPFFSPDGQWIGFFIQNHKLMKMPAAGGAAFEVTDVPTGNWGATWLPDDTIIFSPAFTGAGMARVSADGGEPEALLGLDSAAGEVGHWRPQALPGGERILFVSRRSNGPFAAVLDLTSGEVTNVLPGAVDAHWAETGHLLFSREGELFAVPFDPETLQTGGSPVPLVDGLFTDAQSGEARFDYGANGALVYFPGDGTPAGDQLVWVDREGNVEPIAAETGDYGHPRISPDGSAFAVDRTADSRGDIWIYDLRRDGFTRLTRDGDNRMPVWKPDGLRIAFASNIGGATGIYWKNADGSGDRHPMLLEEYSLWPRSWQDDALAYYELNSDTGRDIWVLRDIELDETTATVEPQALIRSPANERAPALSPDGRWIAYVSDESGRDQVYVQAFRGDPSRTTISTDGGREPVWSRDGSELFYRVANRLIVVPVEAGDRFVAGSPQVLFEGDFESDRMGSNQYFDVAPDGSRFLMVQEGGGSGPGHLHIITGFRSRLLERDSSP